jgi:hypothetical protein
MLGVNHVYPVLWCFVLCCSCGCVFIFLVLILGECLMLSDMNEC